MRKSLEDIKHMVSQRPYYRALPTELEPYHYYIADSGHCIMCVLECHLAKAKKSGMDGYELPVPVKYVLVHGWRKEGDYIIVDAPYRLPFGLQVDVKYYEF
jgi:ketosteroid isomerase-like protein